MGNDDEAKQIVQEVFSLPNDAPMKAEFNRRLDEFMVYFINRNDAGGRAYFLPDYTPEMIQAVMQEKVPVWDVTFETPIWPVKMGRSYDGSLTYIRKIKDNRHIYFFSNSSDKAVDTTVVLRDSLNVSAWNPMNGTIQDIEEEFSKSAEVQSLAHIPLKLDPTSALFFVQEP